MTGRMYGDLKCPSCGIKLDGYTEVNGDRSPEDGDYSICAYCRSVNIYVSHPLLGWRFRPATVFEAGEALRTLREARGD